MRLRFQHGFEVYLEATALDLIVGVEEELDALPGRHYGSWQLLATHLVPSLPLWPTAQLTDGGVEHLRHR